MLNNRTSNKKKITLAFCIIPILSLACLLNACIDNGKSNPRQGSTSADGEVTGDTIQAFYDTVNSDNGPAFPNVTMMMSRKEGNLDIKFDFEEKNYIKTMSPKDGYFKIRIFDKNDYELGEYHSQPLFNNAPGSGLETGLNRTANHIQIKVSMIHAAYADRIKFRLADYRK
jgi:hypothetical protein